MYTLFTRGNKEINKSKISQFNFFNTNIKKKKNYRKYLKKAPYNSSSLYLAMKKPPKLAGSGFESSICSKFIEND